MLSCAHAEQDNLPLSCSAGTGGALLPPRFRRTPPGLTLQGAEPAFSKASLYWVRFTSNLDTRFDVPHKGLGPFCPAAQSLWTSHCALQIKTTGILAVQSCKGYRGAQWKYGAWPQAILAGEKGELHTHHCLARGGEGDPATSSNGGRRISLNFLLLSNYFVPAQVINK